MTEEEIKYWLGVEEDPRPLRPEIVRGMANITPPPPAPTPSGQHLVAFSAFLSAIGGIRGIGDIWEPPV